MTLEEIFEALIKNYNEMMTYNEEMKNQNEYLRHQFHKALKQKKKNILSSQSSSSFGSIRGKDVEQNEPFGSSGKEEPYRRLKKGNKEPT